MNPFEKLKGIPGPEAMEKLSYKRAMDRAEGIPFIRDRVATAKRREAERVRVLADTIAEYMNRALEIIGGLNRANDFYRDLARIPLSEDDLLRTEKRIKNTYKIVNKLKREYIAKIRRANDVKSLAELRKEAFGRILSAIRRTRVPLQLVGHLWAQMRRLPSVDERTPTVVVAGPPNSGKSSLVRRASTAKAEVASYPFTTKDITVGHVFRGGITCQMIDTPGLLDRPLDKRNPVERKAVVCLRHAADSVIYLFDLSDERYYQLDDQLRILNDISSIFGGEGIILAVNKIDITPEDRILELENRLGRRLYKISAKTGAGVKELVDRAISEAISTRERKSRCP